MFRSFILIVIFLLQLSYASNNKLTIAYIGFSTESPFWIELGRSIKKESELKGINLIDLTPINASVEFHKKYLEYAIKSKVDGIIYGAVDINAIKKELDKALKNNIPIIAVDSEIKHKAVKCFITTDNFNSAKIAGEYIVNKTNKQGDILILGGTKDHPNGDARKNGVIEKLKEANMNFIFRQADWNIEKAYKIVKEEFSKDNNISAVFSCWDPGINTTFLFFKKIKYLKKIVLVGFDGNKNTLKYINSGEIAATIKQDNIKMGIKSVNMMINILNEKKIPPKIYISGIFITKKNVLDFLKVRSLK